MVSPALVVFCPGAPGLLFSLPFTAGSRFVTMVKSAEASLFEGRMALNMVVWDKERWGRFVKNVVQYLFAVQSSTFNLATNHVIVSNYRVKYLFFDPVFFSSLINICFRDKATGISHCGRIQPPSFSTDYSTVLVSQTDSTKNAIYMVWCTAYLSFFSRLVLIVPWYMITWTALTRSRSPSKQCDRWRSDHQCTIWFLPAVKPSKWFFTSRAI